MIGEEADRHFTVLDLDELELEPSAPEPRGRIEAHARRCSACAERRAAHVALIEQFRVSVLPRTVEAVTARRRDRLWRRWAAWLALPAAAAAAVLLLVTGRHREGAAPVAGGDAALGVKGGALFEVFARRSGSAADVDGTTVMRLHDGMRLAPGDALRFVLFPNGMPYVLIASVDGAGQVNIYYPFHGEASVLASGQGVLSVPGSIVLDAAPGPERLFVIYSARPLPAIAVRAALAPTAAAGAAAIRSTREAPIEGTVQASLLFEKEDRRLTLALPARAAAASGAWSPRWRWRRRGSRMRAQRPPKPAASPWSSAAITATARIRRCASRSRTRRSCRRCWARSAAFCPEI